MGKLISHLSCNALFISVAAILTALLSCALGSIGGFIAMALLWLPLLGLFPALHARLTGDEGEVSWVLVLGVFVTIHGVADAAPNLPTLLTVPPVRDIRVSDLGRYPQALRFDFSDAVVQTRLARVHTKTSRSGKSGSKTVTHSLWAPLTDAGWTPSQPVLAWAICHHGHASSGHCPDFQHANGGAIIPTSFMLPGDVEGMLTAAAADMGLKNSPDARLLVYGASSETLVRLRVYWLLAVTAGLYLVWAVLFAIVFAFRR